MLKGHAGAGLSEAHGRGSPSRAVAGPQLFSLVLPRAPCTEQAFAKCWRIDVGQGCHAGFLLSLSKTEACPLPSLLLSFLLLSSFPFSLCPVRVSLAGSAAP